MVDENLLTFFIALTTLAVLIQTGIVTGLFVATLKMSRQADRATAEVRRLIDPIHRVVDTMESASLRLSEFSATSKGTVQRVGSNWEQALERLRRKIA